MRRSSVRSAEQQPLTVPLCPEPWFALGRIGLENDQIEAIDVNPLLLRENGTPVAVDAAIWITR